LLGLAQQRNHFLEGRYLDMQLANVEVILALEQGPVKQAQLLIERLRQRARPLFEKSRSALAEPLDEQLRLFHLALLECEDHLDVGQLHVQV
ncbi:helix-turn-helix transcriptional regulator, partial [Pseudomonas aeruginosa]